MANYLTDRIAELELQILHLENRYAGLKKSLLEGAEFDRMDKEIWNEITAYENELIDLKNRQRKGEK